MKIKTNLKAGGWVTPFGMGMLHFFNISPWNIFNLWL
jgi:hypothetical protein